jgi:hypothetical protein
MAKQVVARIHEAIRFMSRRHFIADYILSSV